MAAWASGVHSWSKPDSFIRLCWVHPGARLGAGERPELGAGALPALPRAHPGPDVPIETKFHPPRARAEWVQRRELIGQLADSTARLVLVDAPAGFGKTTLVAQWLSSPA